MEVFTGCNEDIKKIIVLALMDTQHCPLSTAVNHIPVFLITLLQKLFKHT